MTVDSDVSLGIGFRFERAEGGAWVRDVRALLGATVGTPAEPEIVQLNESFIDLLEAIPRPIELAIPEDAQPGLHRICAMNTRVSDACTSIIVE